MEAAAGAADLLLTAGDDVTVLSTTREALRVPGEQVRPVAPLALPSSGPPDPATLAEVPSVRLFVERARAADPGFVLDDVSAPAVSQVCGRRRPAPAR